MPLNLPEVDWDKRFLEIKQKRFYGYWEIVGYSILRLSKGKRIILCRHVRTKEYAYISYRHLMKSPTAGVGIAKAAARRLYKKIKNNT